MKQYRVEVTKDAEADLEQIYAYLVVAAQAEMAAVRLLKEIERKTRELVVFPNGNPAYETVPGYRVAHVKKFQIIYRVDEDERVVYVMRVAHSAQNL